VRAGSGSHELIDLRREYEVVSGWAGGGVGRELKSEPLPGARGTRYASPSDGTHLLIAARVAAVRAFMRRHSTAVTVVGTVMVAGAIAIGLAGHRDDFVTALRSAPLWILGVAVALHLVWLVARSEAWSVCINAAGGRCGRRRLYRASSVGYLGNIFNGQFGLAVRIAALRRTAPEDSPNASVLVAAELPVVVIEAALAAIFAFTLVGPLGLPWWLPLFPVGPSLGAAAAVLILGTGGAAAAAAAGALLTVTAAAGAVCFAAWALVDRLWRPHPEPAF
jgi:uncharacterized membrane protein YbhN (UPF0104 family)